MRVHLVIKSHSSSHVNYEKNSLTLKARVLAPTRALELLLSPSLQEELSPLGESRAGRAGSGAPESGGRNNAEQPIGNLVGTKPCHFGVLLVPFWVGAALFGGLGGSVWVLFGSFWGLGVVFST